MGTALFYFLILVIVIFVVVMGIIAIGFFRSRSYKGEASKTTPEPSINTNGNVIEDRLGTPDLHKKGVDPRGADIGGNFSSTSDRTDTSNQKRS